MTKTSPLFRTTGAVGNDTVTGLDDAPTFGNLLNIWSA